MLLAAGLLMGSGQGVALAQDVKIYSARQEVLIRPLLEAFEAKTGLPVKVVSGKADALLERLKSEGANSPADLLLTTDVGRLVRASEAGVLAPVSSPALEAAIPARYRDPDRLWFGLSLRARPIMYAKDRVSPDELSTYGDLTNEKWRGRVCIRSSSNVYNQSLLAAMVEHLGVTATEAWARGLVANFARKPAGGDRDQIRAVAAGECDLAVANTYYLAQMTKASKDSDRQAAGKVAIFWPDQAGAGTHVNVSGAGVTKSAKNRAGAIALLEYLASEEAQRIYAELVNEYPVRENVTLAPVVAGWGPFKADEIPLVLLGRNNAEAVRIADRAGWR
jgi:iron(III) transport system substrate-binding protein